jgi:hypothetical protein
MIGDEEMVTESYSVVRAMSFGGKCTTKRRERPAPRQSPRPRPRAVLEASIYVERPLVRWSVGPLHEPRRATQPRVGSHALPETVDDCESRFAGSMTMQRASRSAVEGRYVFKAKQRRR